MIRLYVGNTSPSLQDTVMVNGAPFDLTGASVEFNMRPVSSATTKVSAAATVVSAGAGTVRYDWQPGDVDTAGHYVCWWTVTLPSARVQDSDEFRLYISSHAPGDPRDLCTIDDVKAAMEPQSNTSSRDPIIQALITSASVAIMGRLERELAPQTAGATRTVRVRTQETQDDGTLVADLNPYDLRSASLVQLHPEQSSPVTLTANLDYSLEPFGAPQGSYQRIRLSRYLVVVSNFEIRFGYAQLAITGDWGLWNTVDVDNDVRDAVVLTVRAWLRQNPGNDLIGLNEEQGVQPTLPGTWDIPRVALNRIKRYQRYSA